MRARGYLVRVPASELDETFLGVQVLVLGGEIDARAGGISDLLQCTADTAHCPTPWLGVFLGVAHTHAWIGGDHVFLPSSTSVVTAPPEVALEPAPNF